MALLVGGVGVGLTTPVMIALLLVARAGMDLLPALLIGAAIAPFAGMGFVRNFRNMMPEPGEPWAYPWTGVPRIRVWKFVAIATVFAAILVLSERYLLAAILEPIALVAAFVIHRNNRSSKKDSEASRQPNLENP